MPIGSWNLDWLNHNSQRAYPLAANTTKVDTTAGFELPDDFIVGMTLSVHSDLVATSDRFFIKHVGVYSGGYSIVVGYEPETGDAVSVATALIAKEAHETNTTYRLGGMGDFIDTSGAITVGKLTNIDEQPTGYFTFELATTRIEADVIRPLIRGVTGVRIRNGVDTSELMYGVIEVVAGRNVELNATIVDGEDAEIEFNAVDNTGLTEDCLCEEEAAVPIKRINGIGPTSEGNFTIVGDSCAVISTLSHGIRIDDQCSEPCCGCEELAQLTQDLENVELHRQNISNFVSNLECSVNEVLSNVISSRLGDPPS